MTVADVLRQWDKGSKAVRLKILMDFIGRHRNSTCAEIDKDLGPHALLLFTRITAWLRLTYQLGQELSVQLTALSLFLQGQVYLTALMEAGGIQTLTDILCHSSVKFRDDKCNALLILIHIANSGRVYREMICDGAGVDMLVKATLQETDDRSLELIASLFMSLGQGNPRKAALVHTGLVYIVLNGCEEGALCAAATLRSLQLAKQYYSQSTQVAGGAPLMVGAEYGPPEAIEVLLNAFFHLVSSESVKLRFEGTELLSIAAQNAALVTPIVSRCLDVLETDVDAAVDRATTKVAGLRQQAACGRILCSVILNSPGEAVADDVLYLLDRRAAHLTLIKILRQAEKRDISTQRECCKALLRLALATAHIRDESLTNVSLWLKDELGDDLLAQLSKKRDCPDNLVHAIVDVFKKSEAVADSNVLLKEEKERQEDEEDEQLLHAPNSDGTTHTIPEKKLPVNSEVNEDQNQAQ